MKDKELRARVKIAEDQIGFLRKLYEMLLESTDGILQHLDLRAMSGHLFGREAREIRLAADIKIVDCAKCRRRFVIPREHDGTNCPNGHPSPCDCVFPQGWICPTCEEE